VRKPIVCSTCVLAAIGASRCIQYKHPVSMETQKPSAGLIEEDGLLVQLGHASTGAMIVPGCIFWHVIRDNLVQAFAWLQRLA